MKRFLSAFLCLAFTFHSTLGFSQTLRCNQIFFDSNHPFSRSTKDTEGLEKLALEVMREVSRDSRNRMGNLESWIESIRRTQINQPLNVMEHTALLYIVRSGIFENTQDATFQDFLMTTLDKSYSNLTNIPLRNDQGLERLPHRVLYEVSSKERLFHEALFQNGHQASSGAENQSVFARVKSRVGRWIRNSHLNLANKTTILLTAGALAFDGGRESLAGIIIGLAGASINEYLIHIGIGHASEGMQKRLRGWGYFGKFMEEITMTHKLHHNITARRFSSAHLNEQERAKANILLVKFSEDLILDRKLENQESTPALVEEIKSSEEFKKEVRELVEATQRANYGVNGTALGAAAMLTTALPFYLVNLLIYAATGSEFFLVSSMVALTGFILQSLYSHRYMHVKPEDYPNEPNMSLIQRWYMSTFLGQFQTRLHYVHHRSPWQFDRTENGVIMAFSVADYLIRGGVRLPSIKDLLGLEEQGYLDDDHH